MTDQELIQAYRVCKAHPKCIGCPIAHDIADCIAIEGFTTEALIARLEALLRDNAALKREVQKQICKRSELEREIGFKAWICPECGWFVGEQYTPSWARATPHNQGKCNFSSRCGQRIDWQTVESGTQPQREDVCGSG